MIQLPTVALLIIKERKLLLTFSRNKQCFYLPGGKVDKNETPIQALCREIKEELNVSIDAAQLIFYAHISARAYGETDGTIMEQDCYFGKIETTPEPSAEIEKLGYFSLAAYLNELNQAPGAVMILQKLKKDGFID
jgi:8-oxo-dGTP pyrophosphatase MutT (NUDIX family)